MLTRSMEQMYRDKLDAAGRKIEALKAQILELEGVELVEPPKFAANLLTSARFHVAQALVFYLALRDYTRNEDRRKRLEGQIRSANAWLDSIQWITDKAKEGKTE